MATTNWIDPIVDQIHRVREQLARQADFDVQKFADRLRVAEQEHPERLVDGPVRVPELG